MSFAPVALAGMTYAFGFVSHWGAGTETLRHGLVASLLYRATFAVALAAWVNLATQRDANRCAKIPE